jgi:hypothetical protein
MTLANLSDTEQKALRAYVNTLGGRFGPRLVEVLLFGSKARSEVRGLAFDIWLAYGVFLSVRAMSQQGWEALGDVQSLFYRSLKRDGVSLLPQPA